MKKYNEVIKIEVPVNQIARRVYDLIDPEFKHKDILVESIIGNAMHKGGIDDIYNALNGFTNEIDFHVGDIVITSQGGIPVRQFNPETNKTEYAYIKEGEVMDIDIYRGNKIYVKVTYRINVDDFNTKTEWVNHREWNRVVTPILVEE